MERKRQLTKEDRQTIITLKSVGLSFGEIAKKNQGVSEYSFLHHQKELGNWRKLTGRGLADPKPQHIQKTSF